MGWVTVAAYAITFAACVMCQRRVHDAAQRRFWLATALVMLMLGINKQLDLQTWFTEVGRDLAIAHGWYERRRTVQALFIAGLGLLAVAGWAWLSTCLQTLDRHAKSAAFGLLLLCAFVILRAASFHHVDRLIGLRFDVVSLNAALELSGIAWICLSALQRLRADHIN